MKKKYILAIDQGTTGTRAFIFNNKGITVASAYKEFKQYYPYPGWVEHDAQEIWKSCKDVINASIRKANISSTQIAGIGITNQRETTVLWDRKTSKPVARAIVWQCRRTAQICQSLKRYENIFRRKTGLVLDPYFSGTKIKWLLDQYKGLRTKAEKGSLCFGTIDSWIIWNLTGGKAHVTDYTNASRTLIFNIKTKSWDAELLKILKIPKRILPKVQKSGSIFGHTNKNARNRDLKILDGVAISSVLGDQQAALYGQGCHQPGTIKNTYGTGCFMVLNTGQKRVLSKKGLLTTLASDEKGNPVYALEGSVFIAGAVVQWLRDELGVIKISKETELLIKDVADTQGVYFVPAFSGLGAPYWDSKARGVISGLTRGANAKHIIRASLEAIAYQTKDVFDVMKKELNKKLNDLKVDGGASSNGFLMQFQADILNCRIIRPKNVDTTVLGAALLAGVTVGLWEGKKDLDKINKTERIFYPKMTTKRRTELYSGWVKAVNKARA
ncbi:MAG: glycerol kinase GlpK [Candidatus Omnitrophica bacterium]|nr:glycerol kinase GlpK [Candidatus Omnitrophota bacterium]